MLHELLSKFSTEEEKEQYLLQLVKNHPYFTPAQFCLLQNTPVELDVYKQRAATTALLFNSAGWLNYQLNNQFKEVTDELSAAAMPLVTETFIPQEAIPSNNESTASTTASHIAAVIAATEQSAAATTIEKEQEIAANSHGDAAADTDSTIDTEKKPGQLSIPGPGKYDGEMLFQPLYATDYFASQGIKLSEVVQPGDKLGKQLKSFTDWLKSMKKTHPQEAGEAVDTAHTIQHIAEKSNKDGDVVTEAMAEVYALQGSTKKAIAIYHKLSLLNPPKSAYFAAKIETLK
jgi:hypothetical protein